MRTFCLSIEDARYSAPTLEFATVQHPDEARQVAHDRLEASPYHVAVKVREDDELVFWLRRLHASAQQVPAYQSGL